MYRAAGPPSYPFPKGHGFSQGLGPLSHYPKASPLGNGFSRPHFFCQRRRLPLDGRGGRAAAGGGGPPTRAGPLQPHEAVSASGTCQVSPGGEFLFVRTKRNQKCAGGWARKNFKRQGRAFVLSACTPGPPFLRGPIQVMRRISIRRAKSGYFQRRFPLPLMRTRVEAPAAHGRAPGRDGPSAAGVPRGPGTFPHLPMERQRELGAECVILPQRRK